MPRYFLEVGYMGTRYAGFQIQQNANTIQEEVEKALQIFLRKKINLTGSSRTDAGVHAEQNYFHFDVEVEIPSPEKIPYHLNSILPKDIVTRSLKLVQDEAHSRFDATSRQYKYSIYQEKDPFLVDRAYFYPYALNFDLLNEAALLIKSNLDFEAFSKKNVQVHTFICHIEESYWVKDGYRIMYHVKGSRFLRGMVRGLVGTMLKVGREKISIAEFQQIIESKDVSKVDFSTPPEGLTLMRVCY